MRFFNILDNTQNQNGFGNSQNIRLDIVGELEAIVQYENHIAQTNDKSVQATLRDIVKEEKLHVGQLMGLLFSLDEESREQFELGMKEFDTDNKNKKWLDKKFVVYKLFYLPYIKRLGRL